MLRDLIDALNAALDSGNDKKIERALKNLEKVGMDRVTAKIVAREVRKEEK